MMKARRSLLGRLATVFAACLTFATAFGLHPESAGGHLGATADQFDLPQGVAHDGTSHDCLACRAHRPLVSMGFLALAPPLAGSRARVLTSRPSVVPAFEPSRPDGRAPPAFS